MKTLESIESIELHNISFGYDNSPFLFENLSYKFDARNVYQVEAISGTGRSAFLKILAGLLTPQKGKYLINGESVFDFTFEEFWKYRRQIGYSFDFGGLMANRTLWDNMMLPLMYHKEVSHDQAVQTVTQLMEEFQLMDFRDRRPAAAPGSARKSCIVARAFVCQPSVLLLDDPFVALDVKAIECVFKNIRRLQDSGKFRYLFITSREPKMLSTLNPKKVQIFDRQMQAVSA